MPKKTTTTAKKNGNGAKSGFAEKLWQEEIHPIADTCHAGRGKKDAGEATIRENLRGLGYEF